MRYVGSKRRLGKHILPFINEALKRNPKGAYIEPFAGGCNMLSQVQHHTRIGYDANKHLIALLKQTQQKPVDIKNALCPSLDAFNYIRDNKEQFPEWYVGVAGFFPTYANKWMQSYNEHQSPGKFASSINTVLKQNLSGIHLFNGDYKTIPVGSNNVIYCDPPYKHFDFYRMPFNHEQFCDWVRATSKNNIVFVSEYEMPSDFECVMRVTITPGINRAARPRQEKLFMYKG
jgi:DNA adenine methylase